MEQEKNERRSPGVKCDRLIDSRLASLAQLEKAVLAELPPAFLRPDLMIVNGSI